MPSYLARVSTFALAAICALSVSCGLFMESATPGLVEPRTAVPRDFLFSWHEPYNEWMDTPVRVYYNKIPLDQIFHNDPFDRLSYRFIEKPSPMPLVSVDTMGLSRRQLLWSIAHDNNLHMSLKTLPNGHPNEVIIRGRGEDGSRKTGHTDNYRRKANLPKAL